MCFMPLIYEPLNLYRHMKVEAQRQETWFSYGRGTGQRCVLRSIHPSRATQKRFEHVYVCPHPWVQNTFPKIAVIVKKRKWNVIDWM